MCVGGRDIYVAIDTHGKTARGCAFLNPPGVFSAVQGAVGHPWVISANLLCVCVLGYCARCRPRLLCSTLFLRSNSTARYCSCACSGVWPTAFLAGGRPAVAACVCVHMLAHGANGRVVYGMSLSPDSTHLSTVGCGCGFYIGLTSTSCRAVQRCVVRVHATQRWTSCLNGRTNSSLANSSSPPSGSSSFCSTSPSSLHDRFYSQFLPDTRSFYLTTRPLDA